jgi:Polyketide cyclase / dehydrase and lipid transport
VPADVEERVVVAAPAARVYDEVAQVHKLARWSPECFAVWVLRRQDGMPTRFVGFNRRRGYVWFTTCRVVVADPGREFAFDVSTFGMPVSRWGYRMAPVDGGTEVTEYWEDRRSRGAFRLGRIFTGKVAIERPAVNRAGMRTTLQRLKRELESGS